MKKEVRLYNILMPIWLLLFFPILWIPVLLGNFGIDSLVLFLIMKRMKISEKKTVYSKAIFKVFCFGMLSDIIVSVILVGLSILFDAVNLYNISFAIIYNPFSNFFAFVVILMCMALTSLLIYLFDSKFAFKKTDLEKSSQKKISLWIAIITSPWLFLFPSIVLY